MCIDTILGVLVMLAAYACTWWLLLRSSHIVDTIDKEGLTHTREIKKRLRPESKGARRQRKTK